MTDEKKVNYNPPVPPVVRNYDNNIEYGKIGQKRSYGIFWEEFIRELSGRQGCEVYKEMYDNDDIIGSMMFAIENLMKQVRFTIEPQGNTDEDKRAAKFVEDCMNDMDTTWMDTLSEILSFLPFGWSVHEIVYKRRMGKQKDRTLNSRYNDGLIGWKRLPIRSQDTLLRWEYDEDDELAGMTQIAPPDNTMRTIPIEKCLHFRTSCRKNNPEGKSILRNSYRSWYFKRRLQEIEGIGIERDLAGLPMIQTPEGLDIWNTEDPEMVQSLMYAEKLVQSVRRDSKEGIVLPYGWEFSLLNGGSKRQFEVGTTIERYDKRMAMTVLADFVLLGHENVGSFALSSDKTKLFSVAIGSFLDIICEVFNTQGIPKLIEINKTAFEGIADYPKMCHDDIEKPEIDKVAGFIKDMVGIGVLIPDEGMEEYVRELGGLPEKQPGDLSAEEYLKRQKQSQGLERNEP